MKINELNTTDRIRGIKLPEKSEELAEFIGILMGDGFMNYYEKRREFVIDIAGNKLKDRDYLENFVSSLVKELFNLTPSFIIKKNQNSINLRIRSKSIFYFLKQSGFPVGRKGEVFPPQWIIKKDLLFRRFIRGIFDTDGYLCIKNKEGKKYPVIGLVSKSISLLEPIKCFLESLNITSYLGSHSSNNNPRYKKEWIVYKLQISGNKNVNLFFKEIGSNNQRNKLKHKEMGMEGIEPPQCTSFSRVLSH